MSCQTHRSPIMNDKCVPDVTQTYFVIAMVYV